MTSNDQIITRLAEAQTALYELVRRMDDGERLNQLDILAVHGRLGDLMECVEETPPAEISA